MRKSKKFRIVLSALLLTTAMAMLSACGSSNEDTKENNEPVADDTNATSYTVTLNPNGGAFSEGSTDSISLQVKEGTAIDFANNEAVYEGNTLYGWYQPDGSPWPGARKVTEDITLKAKWSEAEEEAEVLPLMLKIDDEEIIVEYENGVYQFNYVSYIYGGYAQRSAKYTIYEDELKTAAEQDDGSTGRVLCLVKSNYVDTTGTIYGEFYNDGEFELYYEYTHEGKTTKYCMNTGYWTYEGYTAPLENTPIPVDESGMGYESAHLDWDKSLIKADTSEAAEANETTEAAETTDATDTSETKGE